MAKLKGKKQMCDEDILARTIYGEARGEGKIGMEAVACVIMNRTKSNKWFTGYEIKAGCKIPSVAQTCLKKYQFSCWNSNDPNCALIKRIDERSSLFRQCLQVAHRALNGSLKDFTNGALYYHSKDVKPHWAANKMPCLIIGNHIFYNNI